MQAEKEYVKKNILAAATPLFYAKGYVKVPMQQNCGSFPCGVE